MTEWTLPDAEALVRELDVVFGLDVDVAHLWPRIVERHEALFGPSG